MKIDFPVYIWTADSGRIYLLGSDKRVCKILNSKTRHSNYTLPPPAVVGDLVSYENFESNNDSITIISNQEDFDKHIVDFL